MMPAIKGSLRIDSTRCRSASTRTTVGTSGRARSHEKGMVLAIEPGIYWAGGGGLRLEDNFLITEDGNEKLCSYPDDFRC